MIVVGSSPASRTAPPLEPVRHTQYRCATGTEDRKRKVRAADGLNGIDYIEVASDRITLRVVFLSDDGVAGLTAEQIAIEGGVRVADLSAAAVTPDGATLVVECSQQGDLSTYTLRLRASALEDEAPSGFDPLLASADFSFRAGCPNPFDCRHDPPCPPETAAVPDLDYLAKDYDSFRELMLDRMALLAPDWDPHHPADALVTVVELLAAVGDDLSYYQDAVATEAYLDTARLRRSLRRHARLLDYHVHDGCNARAWLWMALEAAEGAPVDLAGATPVLGRDHPGEPATLTWLEYDENPPSDDDVVFATLHPATLRPGHHWLDFYTWDGQRCCLPAGATRATLHATTAARAADDEPVARVPVELDAGDFLLLEETAGPGSGERVDADPDHRHVVRLTSVRTVPDPVNGIDVIEIAWSQADALPFALCISAEIADEDGRVVEQPVAVARGNLILADHGRPAAPADLVPSDTPSDPARAYRPRVTMPDLSFAHPAAVEHDAAACDVIHRDPRAARPSLEIDLGGQTWRPAEGGDLIGADRFARRFVVEVEADGHAWLRFGDDWDEQRPPPGVEATATARFGNGRVGNVGRDTLRRVVTDAPIAAVTNPLPAAGGIDPETPERIRTDAPEAFRVQARAVTPDDYAHMAAQHPQVQQATASLKWTGSWHTVSVAVDRRGARRVDPALAGELRAHLEPYRMAGHDLRIVPPHFASLGITLRVCVASDHVASDVQRALLEVLSSGRLADGRTGLFHPDRFTFATPLYKSEVYAAATAVDGVAWVEATRFARWDAPARDETEDGALWPADHEIFRLDNDPNRPEHGRLELDMEGGR